MSNNLALHPKYCYDSISASGCTRGSACPLQHGIVRCSCDLVLLKYNYPAHVNGKRHRKAMAGTGPPTRYQAGSTQPSEPSSFGPSSSSNQTTTTRCPHCSRDFPNWQFDDHVKAHDVKKRLHTALEDAQQNKRGIKVEGLEGVDFGVVGEEDPEQAVQVKLEITRQCEEPASPLVLRKCRLLSSTRKDEHGERFSATILGSPWINPGRPRSLSITFHPSYAGRYEDTLELVFYERDAQPLPSIFVIHRRVLAIVGNREDHEQLKPTAPYSKTRRKRVPLGIDGPIRRSLRPPTWTKTKWVSMLPKFDVPRTVTDALYNRSARSRKDTLALVKRLMPVDFTTQTYGARFQILLYLEEEQMKQDLDAYTMDGVTLKPNYPRYELEIEGLAEGRPSVLVGDFILVRQEHATDKTWFQGRVHRVYENKVSLAFDDSFSTYRGNAFNVRFVLNRLSFRRMHAAITNTNNFKRLLFPGPDHVKLMRRVDQELIDSIVPINRHIGEDPEQLETVAAIVNMPPGSPPFVLFGPPGTGKTVTIVEAMRQLFAHRPTARILVCAPNNSAADLIAQRLSVLGPSNVLRLNSLTRKVTDMPKVLRPFAIINDNTVFAMPLVEHLRKFRIVVSTCITAGVPANLGIERGFYSHIFVDEAGQAMEPAVMIPLKTLADDKTNVVLAGDNKQLGPIVHSGLASVLGLKTSYLARLMDREVYGLDGNVQVGGRGVTIVKLVRNFRSHHAILEFSNQHFYNRELQYCGDPALTQSLENSNELPTKRFPLIFHGIIGKDQREASSPSFFNIEEATLVKKYCASLVSERKNAIRAEHIAVITPYHAQRIKILNLLYRDPKLRDIKVGSVEEFQGQERRIVIISTVRSNTDFITADITRTLGFVASPHRFNVAITRAQALLVVVGNPVVLSLDPLWRGFLNYIHRGGGWRGKAITWDPEAPVDGGDGSDNGGDSEMRRRAQKAASDAEDTLARLKALITRKNEEIEDDFVFDLADSDDDGEGGGFRFGEGRVFREED